MRNKFIGSRWFYGLCSILLFGIETLIALYVHDSVIRPYLGDVLVVVLVYCFVRLFITYPWRGLPLAVFLFAVLVEVMQYFQLADTLELKDHAIVRVILGSVFDWKDILCYAIGCLPLFFIKR